MPMKFTAAHAARLPDATAEAIRKVHDQQIVELQGQARAVAGASGWSLGPPQILTGTGTYNPKPGTRMVHMLEVGGGGGGGGATPGGGVGAGAGGTSGTLLDIWITAEDGKEIRGGAFAAGAGGAAGSSAGGSGGNGGDSTIVINGRTYRASGGGGGQGMVGTATNSNAIPTGPSGTTSTGGIATFDIGGVGLVIAGAVWFSGEGGSTAMGGGGIPVGGSTAGNSASGGGGGGSGAATAAGGKAGGLGGAGAFVIEEYS